MLLYHSNKAKYIEFNQCNETQQVVNCFAVLPWQKTKKQKQNKQKTKQNKKQKQKTKTKTKTKQKQNRYSQNFSSFERVLKCLIASSHMSVC